MLTFLAYGWHHHQWGIIRVQSGNLTIQIASILHNTCACVGMVFFFSLNFREFSKPSDGLVDASVVFRGAMRYVW